MDHWELEDVIPRQNVFVWAASCMLDGAMLACVTGLEVVFSE